MEISILGRPATFDDESSFNTPVQFNDSAIDSTHATEVRMICDFSVDGNIQPTLNY